MVDARQLAVQLARRRQPSRPPVDDERPDRRRLRYDGEEELVVRRGVGVDGDQSADLGVYWLVLVRPECVAGLGEAWWTVVHVDYVDRHSDRRRPWCRLPTINGRYADFHLTPLQLKAGWHENINDIYQ